MEDALPVSTGFWTDHTQASSPIWTVDASLYKFVNILTGILLGIAQPAFERLITHACEWFKLAWLEVKSRYRHYKQTHISRGNGSGETQTLLPQTLDQRATDNEDQRPAENNANQAQEPASWHALRAWWKERFAGTSLKAGWRSGKLKLFLKLLSWVIPILVIGYALAGSFMTDVSQEQAALLASDRCGLWGLRWTHNEAALDEDALILGQRETRAGQYARDCYPSQSATSLDRCSIFRNRRIPTSPIERYQDCPFVNDTYCYGTGSSAVKFTTGLVDATSIGVNAHRSPKLNRTTICVPLNMNNEQNKGPGFVKPGSGPLEWRYDLGPIEDSKYTFIQYDDYFEYDVRSYTMSSYLHVYSKPSYDNFWQPIPALNIRSDLRVKSDPYSITIMFINSCRIYYKASSDDPVFPTDRKEDDGLYVNSKSLARPLVCIDWIEACSPDGRCSPTHSDEQDVDENFVFTRFAVNQSTTFHSIEFRGPQALDAQYKIEDYTSLPLSTDPPQWVVESWNLFNTSLARIQYDALDIARGTGSDNPLYEPQMAPVWMNGKLCGKFLVQVPPGYNNIEVGMQVFLFLLPMIILAFGLDTGVEFGEKTKKGELFDGFTLLLIELLIWCTLDLGKELWRKLGPESHAAPTIDARVDPHFIDDEEHDPGDEDHRNDRNSDFDGEGRLERGQPVGNPSSMIDDTQIRDDAQSTRASEAGGLGILDPSHFEVHDSDPDAPLSIQTGNANSEDRSAHQ